MWLSKYERVLEQQVNNEDLWVLMFLYISRQDFPMTMCYVLPLDPYKSHTYQQVQISFTNNDKFNVLKGNLQKYCSLSLA